MKRERGITLVALIITIIVLLILAGVALATLTGQGNIIENAENAVGKYNNSVIKEQEILNEIEKYLINNGYGGNEGVEDKPNPPIEGEITITPSTTKWTNKDITIEVIYPEGTESMTKEISIDNGDSWNTYTGEVTISSNCTIKARVQNGEEIKSASLSITNIDKEAPNTFVPEISVTSNSITISGKTTDKEATSTNGSSGIEGYYYSKDGGSSWQTNEEPLTESYTYTGLSQGTSYPLKMKAVDKAGNETVIDIGNKTTTNIAGLGTITIKPSTTSPTNQDIKVSVTWPSNTEGLTKQISVNNGSTWSTYTGEVTISSNCTVKARLIDSTNQEGTTASLTISNIDKNEPIVTVTQNSLEINEGDSYEVSNYFTINANGNAPITNTTYSVTNTSSLGVGTHTITCTVTKANGLSMSENLNIIVNSNIPTEKTTLWYADAESGTLVASPCMGSITGSIEIPRGVNVIMVEVYAKGANGYYPFTFGSCDSVITSDGELNQVEGQVNWGVADAGQKVTSYIRCDTRANISLI